jgi:peptidoglycan hydrolase-like protein with peptidoglycan-binding domain
LIDAGPLVRKKKDVPMTQLSYRQPGLVLQSGSSGELVRDLQHDLRSIGYLSHGIEGDFGAGTTLAVQALQHDLLTNNGSSAGSDGNAPVKVADYNQGRVPGVSGQVDQALVACISDILDDAAFPKLPWADDPAQENKRIAGQIANMASQDAPIPFLLAMLKQESDLKHFREPAANDHDNFIVVGMDRNSQGVTGEYAITSRGYGVGQYTLFHHPPTAQEVQQIMLDPTKNVMMTIAKLRDKFDHFVAGNDSSRADDRLAEVGGGPLRRCKYAASDPRYMTDCRACAIASGVQSIVPGTTPWYAGSNSFYEATRYYDPTRIKTAPVRASLGCDWPYAARRYNGSGVNSYWYQAMVLNHLLEH